MTYRLDLEQNSKQGRRSKKRKRSDDLPQIVENNVHSVNGAKHSSVKSFSVYGQVSQITLENTEKGRLYLQAVFRGLEMSGDLLALMSLLITVLKEQKAVSPLVLRYLKCYEGMFFYQQQVVNLLDALHTKVCIPGFGLFIPLVF